MRGAIEGWKKTASWVLTSGALGDAQWTVANDTLNHVAGVMGFVAVGVGAYSIVKNAIRGRAGEVFASLFATVLAWPLTVVCATLLVRGVSVGDKLTSKILEWNSPAFDEIDLDANVFGDVFGVAFALILALLIVIGGVVMLAMTCVRLFLIILGVGFMPVVTMLIGLDSMRAGLSRYANWILGVILMQPLMAVIMYICGELMKSAGPDAPLTYLVAATGVVLSSICPWVMVRVVGQFLPFQSGSAAAANAGASTVQSGMKAAAQAADMGVRVATGGLSAGAVDLGAKAAASDAAKLGAGEGRDGTSGQDGGASTGEKLKAAGRGFGGHAGAFAGAVGEYMDARESARDAAGGGVGGAGDAGGRGGDAAPGEPGGSPDARSRRRAVTRTEAARPAWSPLPRRCFRERGRGRIARRRRWACRRGRRRARRPAGRRAGRGRATRRSRLAGRQCGGLRQASGGTFNLRRACSHGIGRQRPPAFQRRGHTIGELLAAEQSGSGPVAQTAPAGAGRRPARVDHPAGRAGTGVDQDGEHPLVLLIAVSLIDVNGRSLWQILATRLGFQLRRATGQTRWTVSPMAVDSVTSMIDLPGAAGERLRRVNLVDTMFAGASYLEDLADGTVTAVLRADAANWMFAPSRTQAERAAGFREMQRVTCMLPGVRRVDTQMRCLMRPAPDDAPGGDGFAERDVRWVREHEMRMEPLYDVIIAITLDRRGIAREVKAAGGGAKGVSAVLKDRSSNARTCSPRPASTVAASSGRTRRCCAA